MAPSSTQQVLLSPAELSYLHTSLSLTPPIRPDSRTASQFRPLIAESNILPGTNGSARICFADGTEAIVGIKDDDSMPVFLSALLGEALLADGEFTRRLWINERFHWKLYLDVSLCLSSVAGIVLIVGSDITAVTAIVLSSSAPLTYHPPGSPVY